MDRGKIREDETFRGEIFSKHEINLIDQMDTCGPGHISYDERRKKKVIGTEIKQVIKRT